MDGSLLLPLLSGMVLTFVVQSTAPVIVAGIGMAAAGFLAVDQVLVLYCGACLGSSLILYLLTMAVTGRARQVAMYQVLFNCVLSAIFVPLICIEAYGGVPLIAAALSASGLPLAQSLGAVRHLLRSRHRRGTARRPGSRRPPGPALVAANGSRGAGKAAIHS